MTGTIGLTRSGQLLDEHIDTFTKNQKRTIVKFISNFSIFIDHIWYSNLEYENKSQIFQIVRKNYKEQVNVRFEKFDEYTKSLLFNYIHTLTRMDFEPSTKTQQSLCYQNLETSNFNVYSILFICLLSVWFGLVFA
jgi:flagellar motor switch protein FliG